MTWLWSISLLRLPRRQSLKENVYDLQDAPEQYIRNLDVDTAQDTDSPRSCGYALLQSLLLLHEEGVASTLTSFADELHQVSLSLISQYRT